MKNKTTFIQNNSFSSLKNKNIEYFSQVIIFENTHIQKHLPNIKEIVLVTVDSQILRASVINTIKGSSYEGHHLQGKKIVVDIKIKQKILYMSDGEKQSIHAIENEFYKSTHIIVPNKIEGTDIEKLLNLKFLNINIYPEDIVVKILNKRTFANNLYIFLEANFIPTYELCYSLNKSQKKSDLFIMFEDGSNNTQITLENCSKIKPEWSPCGKKIAFLSNYSGEYMLCTLDIKTSKINKITNSLHFKYIKQFCWQDNNKIVCLGKLRNQNKEELFSIDTNTLNWSQLTFKSELTTYEHIRYSFDKHCIAFLKKVSNMTSLCSLDSNGIQFNELVSSEYINDFCWSKYGTEIIYIRNKSSMNQDIVSLDLETLKKDTILNFNFFCNIKKIEYSPFIDTIAFIGTSALTEDIYIYSFKEKIAINITNNAENIKIKDFIWKENGSKIYYSANYLGYYNVYSIYLDTYTKKQLTNIDAVNIQLTYRPKIL